MELKHKPDRIAAQVRQRFVSQVFGFSPDQEQSAGARFVEQAHQFEQGAFAGPGWTDQRGKFAAAQDQVGMFRYAA